MSSTTAASPSSSGTTVTPTVPSNAVVPIEVPHFDPLVNQVVVADALGRRRLGLEHTARDERDGGAGQSERHVSPKELTGSP